MDQSNEGSMKKISNVNLDKLIDDFSQIEKFDTKLARVQTKSKSYPDATILPQSIYRRKLQYLQEEKSKEIASLQNTIRDLEQRLAAVKDSRLTRRRF
ncbi:Coiled-coil domain-containing protein 152 [Cricetulus griseus]|uniref:Coiled-coil domain-containing protein 152 n=1 Tax=Cricetulus griseus TaxID=10029 RepID=G3ID69_CRIGR|nr:Coiled-coil domain-containing protein 152 [Cricetulus griseus]